MRMYGYLKEPYHTNKTDMIYKVMIHSMKKHGTMVYLYTSLDAAMCSFDVYYPDVEAALEDWQEQIDDRGWIQIDDPMPDCQHDAFLPIRVKGRNTGNPEWGQLEIYENGAWKDYVQAP